MRIAPLIATPIGVALRLVLAVSGMLPPDVLMPSMCAQTPSLPHLKLIKLLIFMIISCRVGSMCSYEMTKKKGKLVLKS